MDVILDMVDQTNISTIDHSEEAEDGVPRPSEDCRWPTCPEPEESKRSSETCRSLKTKEKKELFYA